MTAMAFLSHFRPATALLLWLAIAPLMARAADAPAFWTDAHSGLEFAQVPGGCFFMGVDAPGEISLHGQPSPPRGDEMPRHEVCVDSFWLARTEVSGAAWQGVMGNDRERAPTQPASGISIEEAEDFLARLNRRASGERYRLPTEAEWEHACLAGEAPPDPSQLSYRDENELRRAARFLDPSYKMPGALPVATLAPNRLGLYDMLGNVWEWTADDYAGDAYSRHARDNPLHRQASGRRSLRGGSFQTHIFQVRCGARAWGVPGDRLSTVGLRVLREVPAGTDKESSRRTK